MCSVDEVVGRKCKPGTQSSVRVSWPWARTTLFVLSLLAFAVVPLFVASATYQLTIIIASGLAALAVAILLRAGLISFGHGLYYAVGAYAVAYLAPVLHVGAIALLVFGAAIAGLVALIAGLFMVRYRGIFFAMLNLALSMAAYMVLLKFYALTGGSDGMPVMVSSVVGIHMGGAGFTLALFYLSLNMALILGWLVTRYLRAPLGWGLSAVQNSEIRVEYLGRSARSLLLVAYVISGLLAGLGGAITAMAVGHVDPGLGYWVMSAEFLVIAVLGGVGNVVGSFVGAVLYQLLSVNAAQYLAYTWGILLGVVILVIIRFAPAGLWGIYDSVWTTRKRR